ncbi:4925_t:CDS:2 [Ambispora leptoticha]|uniref:4925_t:CDS:1 n=1 Tax=Ambispora leptoticha TaxID=144679 RepID=A0A9N9F655_9GLOM|nr:4925_t:CDS:2 [Ambispora leptoticha]
MAEIEKTKNFAESTFTNKTTTSSQQPLSRGKSVVGPRPLPTSTNSNITRRSSNSSTSNSDNNSITNKSSNIVNNTSEQSRSVNPDAASTFPKLVSPTPHKPMPTVQNDISRALESQTAQQETDNSQTNQDQTNINRTNSISDTRYPSSDNESWYAGDEKNLTVIDVDRQQKQLTQSRPTPIQYPSPYNKPGRASEDITRTTPMLYSEQRGHSSAPTSPIAPIVNIQEHYQYNNNGEGSGPMLSHSQSWNNMAIAGAGQGQIIQPNNFYALNNQNHWNAPNGQQYDQNGRPISYVAGGIPLQQPPSNYYPRNPSPLGSARQPSPQFGPDGTPLPPNLGGTRQSFYGPGAMPRRSPSPNPDYRLSRSPNTSNLRLLIDDKNAKRMTFTSFTLASDDTALQKYRETASKTNDPLVQVDYAKFLIGMTNFYFASNTNQEIDPNKTDMYTKLVNEAVYWIDKLAKNNQPEAMYIKGTWYESGKFTKEQNHEKALKYYSSASKQDHPKANTKVGEHYERQRNFSRAISFFQKAASLGDVSALYRLALIYMLGDMRQEVNYKQAMIYLKQAASKADEDCPEGAFVYGMILAKEYQAANVPDELVVPDEHEAKELIQKAANFGYAPALYKMGHCHEYAALGCPYDPELSVSYYERAANKGYVEANMALSKWYLCGAEGYFDQNEMLAYMHAEIAAKKGLAAAEFAMGYFHEVGINTQVDPKTANEWYSKAAVHGNQDAIERLSRGGTITRQEHDNTVQTKLKKQRKPDKDKDCVIQ